MPAVLFSYKTMEPLENGLQPHSGVTPLFSLRTVLLALYNWYKQVLTFLEMCLYRDDCGVGRQHVKIVLHNSHFVTTNGRRKLDKKKLSLSARRGMTLKSLSFNS